MKHVRPMRAFRRDSSRQSAKTLARYLILQGALGFALGVILASILLFTETVVPSALLAPEAGAFWAVTAFVAEFGALFAVLAACAPFDDE